MAKIDLKKTIDGYKAKAGEFKIITIPRHQYLMIDGHGDPNTAKEFADAISALYPVAYKLKFASKIALGKDYVVPPLEGLWWAPDMSSFTAMRDKSEWDWTMMSLVPDWITREMYDEAVQKVAETSTPASLGKMRLEELNEGPCVQTLHIGSYDTEAVTLTKMHQEFIPGHNLKMVKKHHEVYLSDMRKVSPGKLKTILRQPVEAVDA